MSQQIKNRILKTELINWKELHFIQDIDFKAHSPIDKHKLKQSLLNNGFAAAFNVWQDSEGVIWCLDGYHRVADLKELETEGVVISEQLPANFIECKDRQEAALLVLVYSSHYAQITQEGFTSFLSEYGLEGSPLLGMLSLPEIPTLEVTLDEMPEDLTADPKDKPAKVAITFDSPEDLENARPYIEDIIKQFPNSFYSVSCGEI